MRWRLAALGAAVIVGVSVGATAHPAPRDDYFARLAAAVRRGYDDALAARAPKLVPPVPIAVRWKATRVGSLELGAPLVAMTAADLDEDGKSELYLVTTRDVLAVGVAAGRVHELGRVAFAGELAVPASRDPVGTAIVEGAELVVAASPWAHELRVSWQVHGGGRALVGQLGAVVASAGAPVVPGSAVPVGVLVCPGERLPLVPGRNHFGDVAQPVYGVRCRADLVDAEGAPLRVRATLLGTRIEVLVDRCSAGGTACVRHATHEYKDYGFAFELADLDRDGTPELVVTGAGARGDADAVKVIELGGDARTGLFRQPFTGGVVGVTALDSDGDGAQEIVAAVRLAGATRVDLWRLN